MKKRSRQGLRRFRVEVRSWGNYVERIADLERALAKKPRTLQIEIVGTGEIPADVALRFRTALMNVAAGRPELRNLDFDTGIQSKHGEYALADDTYAELLDRLADDDELNVPAALSRNIAAFYGPSPAPSSASHQDRKHWKDTMKALAQIVRWARPSGRAITRTSRPDLQVGR